MRGKTWMSLGNMLIERSQSQKTTSYDSIYVKFSELGKSIQTVD